MLGSPEHRGTVAMAPNQDIRTAAEAYLVLLKARGIDWLLANAGTDFAPIIEALARGPQAGLAMPEPVVVPHENAAVGMAHGYYLVTGRPLAVMVHVNVGTANALMGLLNAARDNVPIFFTSGRTPITDADRVGARDLPIHWGQEMRDQAGMLREYVKWDYELRYGEQVELMVDRALAIAMSEPRGPVYLSLPREALATPVENFSFGARPVMPAPATPHPDPAAIEEAAGILAAAERPLIIAGRGESSACAFAELADIAERFALPVAHFWPSRLALATDHPMHVGFDSGPWLENADAVVVLDAMVPWIPKRHAVPDRCQVIQIGPDPLFADLPMRSFAANVAIAADVPASLEALGTALAARGLDQAKATASRRARVTERNADRQEEMSAAIEAGRGTPMGPAWVSHCLDRIKGRDGVVFNELACDPAAMTFTEPGCYFSHSLAGGLGWGLPAALGAKLAERDRLVIAAVGDGSYMFANPVACHQVGEALRLPVLTVVFNNGVWNAVRKTTRAVYPDGFAARSNRMPLASLEPSPAYEKIVEASNGYGERVETADALPAALERALHAVRKEKRQALLNVVCT
jgi:acetolactate synthase-1/2/3 large subunit